jgi:hypothetical protein
MRATCIDRATYDTQGLLNPPCPFSCLVGFLVSLFVLYPCRVPRGLQPDNRTVVDVPCHAPPCRCRHTLYLYACMLPRYVHVHHMFNHTIVRYFLGNVGAIPVSGR